MTDQPAGKSLCHFIFVGKIIGNTHYDVGEHDADQRDHDNILELDTLDEPDKDPCTQNGTNEGKGSTSPQGRTRCKQQSQQNAKLCRRDRCACGGRNNLFMQSCCMISPATLMPMPVQRMASRRGRREIRKISHVSTLPVNRSEGRMSSTPTNKEQTERIISRTPRKAVER